MTKEGARAKNKMDIILLAISLSLPFPGHKIRGRGAPVPPSPLTDDASNLTRNLGIKQIFVTVWTVRTLNRRFRTCSVRYSVVGVEFSALVQHIVPVGIPVMEDHYMNQLGQDMLFHHSNT